MRKTQLFPFLSPAIRCFLLIFFCFTLTSGVWLSWLYHLITLADPRAVDLLSMGAGYLFQALGLFLLALAEHKGLPLSLHSVYCGVVLLFALCAVPALLSPALSWTLAFGFLLGILIGMIAGIYLRQLSLTVDSRWRGRVFGGSYALSTVSVFLLSRIGGNSFLHSGAVLPVYLILTAICLLLTPDSRSGTDADEKEATQGLKPSSLSLPLVAATVFLLSSVKNIGFSFPSADLMLGVDLELSRVLYAAGLVIAGVIADRSRRHGAICSLAALITPFIILALSGEPISSTIFWGLDYLLFGFFSVFRILVFSDLAGEGFPLVTAGFGLLFGRIGDSLSIVVSTLLAGHQTALVLLAAVFFTLSVLLFFRFYQALYLQPASPVRSEEELFAHFASRFDLSARERGVLRLLLAERSNAEIAQELYVTESTVKFHVHNLLKKTGCKNRLELLSLFHLEK